MSTSYAHIFGKPLDALVAQDVVELAERQERESQYLDFKAELPAKGNRDEYRQLARHIAGFANAEGGVIVYGVRESNDHAVCVKPVPLGEAAANFLKSVNGYLHPPIPGLAFRAISEAGMSDGFVVLGIPSSGASPHAVAEEGGGLSYWRRSGRDRHAMTEADVERAYRSRWTRYQDAAELLGGLLSSTERAVDYAGLSVVAVPIQPRIVYANARGGIGVLEGVAANLRKGKIEDSQWGSQIGVDVRAGFQYLECGNWPDRARATVNQGDWYCIVLRRGGFGLARQAQRQILPPHDPVNVSHSLSVLELERAALAHLVSARAICAAFGTGGELLLRYGLHTPSLGLHLVADNGYNDVLGSRYGNAFDQEVMLTDDLYEPQQLLGIAKRIVEDLYPAFGKPMASVLIQSEEGGLIVDARKNRGDSLRTWCALHNLPVK